MEHGIVKDWNDMERIWQYVCSKDQLQTFSEEVRAFNIEAMGHAEQPEALPRMRQMTAIAALSVCVLCSRHQACAFQTCLSLIFTASL